MRRDQTGSDEREPDLTDLPAPETIPDTGEIDDEGRSRDPEDDQTQDWQNDENVPEPDDNNEIVEEGEPQNQQAPPEPPRPAYVPPKPAYMTQQMAEEEKARINELILTDPVAALDAHAAFLDKQRTQADNVTRWRRNEIERKYPDFAREHAPMIDAGLQQLTPQQRSEDWSETYALFHAMGAEVMQDPKRDMVAVLERNLALMKGAQRQQQRQAPVRPALAPQQRTTPSSTTSAATRPPAAVRGGPQQRRSNLSPGAQILKNSGMHEGLSDSALERAAQAMGLEDTARQLAAGGRR